jgi:hypothetical protein
MSVPNDFPVIAAIYSSGGYYLTTHEGHAAFVDAAVRALHAADPRWGHLKKKPGQTQIHGHAEDAALYKLPDGTALAVDFIIGAGGPNPRPGWNVGEFVYKHSDWLDPDEHDGPPTPPPTPFPPYPGDAAFDVVGTMLFADYARAENAPDPQMGRWFGRAIYDWLAKNKPTLDASVHDHRSEWRRILNASRLSRGLPPVEWPPL